MRCGASCGVSTYTTNQSVFSRPAMREPRRRRVAPCGGYDDRHTITRSLAAALRDTSEAELCAATDRSMFSATSRREISRRTDRFSALKKCWSAQEILSEL